MVKVIPPIALILLVVNPFGLSLLIKANEIEDESTQNDGRLDHAFRYFKSNRSHHDVIEITTTATNHGMLNKNKSENSSQDHTSIIKSLDSSIKSSEQSDPARLRSFSARKLIAQNKIEQDESVKKKKLAPADYTFAADPAKTLKPSVDVASEYDAKPLESELPTSRSEKINKEKQRSNGQKKAKKKKTIRQKDKGNLEAKISIGETSIESTAPSSSPSAFERNKQKQQSIMQKKVKKKKKIPPKKKVDVEAKIAISDASVESTAPSSSPSAFAGGTNFAENSNSDQSALYYGYNQSDTDGGTTTIAKQAGNVIIITTDQQRYDAWNLVQNEMSEYSGKLKVRTPNLNKLATGGVYFRNAYCVCPSCAPARASLRTGNTMERTGMQSNFLVDSRVYMTSKLFSRKIEALETYDQLLVEKRGYQAESYGKFHLPWIFYNGKQDKSKTVITYDEYDYQTNQFKASKGRAFQSQYKQALKFLAKKNNLKPIFKVGQQPDPTTGFPYDPIALDSRFGENQKINLKEHDLEKHEDSLSNVMGLGYLPTNYSKTTVNGDWAVLALDRLGEQAKRGKPFCLTVSYGNPHPPEVSSPEYQYYYWKERSKIYVSKSYKDLLKNTAYEDIEERDMLIKDGYDYNSRKRLQEWTALYYALVEEIDVSVGKIMEKLEEVGQLDNTLVIFTSDHGEMLGAHGLRGKSLLLEESTRIPLIMSYPGKIAPGTVVNEPVSHMDVFATIMDYLGASAFDNSDGKSLRRYIEKKSYNKFYDEAIAVSEIDDRYPKFGGKMNGHVGDTPNFMIRKGHFKLILTKKADSPNLDMMYNLRIDPNEMDNLIGKPMAKWHIGKAEHLKILLLEWMYRNDGDKRYYSNNMWNEKEGKGDIREIKDRQTWPVSGYWQSDDWLAFGSPALVGKRYKRHEYLYIGRTKPGTLSINNVVVLGDDRKYFSVDKKQTVIKAGKYIRIRVTFSSKSLSSVRGLKAYIKIYSNAGNPRTCKIVSGE